VDDIFKLITILFLGSIFVAVLLNAKGFSLAAGTLFTGLNNSAKTLQGR
jgi:hypothetical protein